MNPKHLLIALYAIAHTAFAQTPSSPLPEAAPVWSRVVAMLDGRTFVTDGGLAIDAAVAKPASLPPTVISADVFGRYLSAPHEHEVSLGDLSPGDRQNTFVTPSGVALNGNYVRFLRELDESERMSLRVRGVSDPVVIELDEQPIGVLMPSRSLDPDRCGANVACVKFEPRARA